MKNLQAFCFALAYMIIYTLLIVISIILHSVVVRYFYETYGPWSAIYYQCTALLTCFSVLTYIRYRKFKDEV